MGLLIDGKWYDQGYDTEKNEGKFIRSASQFRNMMTDESAAEKSAENSFKAEKDRYHLYVSLACPWAHRALIFRKLKKLESIIPVSVVNFEMREQGWSFNNNDDSLKDHLYQFDFVHQLYTLADANYSGRVTVPILWDKKNKTIVNNESSEIIRIFNSAFDKAGAAEGDYYPAELRSEIDELNQRIYSQINNGVYKAGFATTQSAYDENVVQLFEALDWLEELLSDKRYLTGPQITEADWRLFTTMIRFDPVYVSHFKCNLRRLIDYPNLFAYIRDLYQQPGVAETVDMQHIKNHYFMSHPHINPTGIVPAGPMIDFGLAHQRDRISG